MSRNSLRFSYSLLHMGEASLYHKRVMKPFEKPSYSMKLMIGCTTIDAKQSIIIPTLILVIETWLTTKERGHSIVAGRHWEKKNNAINKQIMCAHPTKGKYEYREIFPFHHRYNNILDDTIDITRVAIIIICPI